MIFFNIFQKIENENKRIIEDLKIKHKECFFIKKYQSK